jgi:polyisoprenoid-binding protein YceI
MKMDKNSPTRFLIAVMLLVFGSSVLAETLIRYEAKPGSKVRIEGTSTLHAWEVEGQMVGGWMDIEPAFQDDPTLKTVSSLNTTEKNPKVSVRIPVRSLRSGKKLMDDVMHEAMKQKQHPFLEYNLMEMVLKEDPESAGSPAVFNTKGELTVAGVKKEVPMDVTMERLENNRLKFTGTVPIKMSDFGISPPAPRVALGLIRTGDDVTVSVEWITELRANSAQAVP